MIATPRVLDGALPPLLRGGIAVDTEEGPRTTLVARIHEGRSPACDLVVRADDGRCVSAWLVVRPRSVEPERLGAMLAARILRFVREELVDPSVRPPQRLQGAPEKLRALIAHLIR